MRCERLIGFGGIELAGWGAVNRLAAGRLGGPARRSFGAGGNSWGCWTIKEGGNG